MAHTYPAANATDADLAGESEVVDVAVAVAVAQVARVARVASAMGRPPLVDVWRS